MPVTVCRDGNWDIVKSDGEDALYAIAVEPGCKNSWFGKMRHLVHIVSQDKMMTRDVFTLEGLKLLEGYLNPRGMTLDDLFEYQKRGHRL